MLAIKNPGEWIEIVVVVLIVAGSALSGIVKTIIAKLNRSREEAEAQRELEERPPSRAMDRTPPPVARPMPPRRPAATYEHRPVARPMVPQRPQAEVPRTIPPVVQTILDVVLDGAVDVEEVLHRPQPSRPQPPPAPRPARTSGPKPARHVSQRATGRRSIENREERKAKLVEKRLGHVESHVASPTLSSSADSESDVFERPTRRDLRRAVILNEILSPPLSIRRPD